jgi:UDP-glucose 4-epimerase
MGRKKSQLDFALKFWVLTHVAKRIGGVPPFRQLAGLIASERAFKGSFIPVDEEIEIPPSVVAPREILVDYITRASFRAIVHECPCRKGQGCENHPQDIGCMLLGDAARRVDPDVARQATVEEALAHVDRALEAGLLPLMGHLLIDKYIFGLRDFDRFLTLCFCCRCCCVVRSGMRNLVEAYPRSLVRLEGIEVAVTEECVGCGECVAVCPVENVGLEDGRAVIGDRCLGCGTCARTCSRGHISIIVRPDSSPIADLRRRVEAGVVIE